MKNLIIEINSLHPYSVNSANRGQFGEVKSASIGAISRAIFSSQSIKFPIRTKMADGHMRTNYFINEIFDECRKIDSEKAETPDFLLYLLNVAAPSLKESSQKDKNESDKAYAERLLSRLMNGEGVKASTTEVSSQIELPLVAKTLMDSYISEDKKDVAQKKLSSLDRTIDMWTALFGRMSTNSLFTEIEGAMSVAFSYSVDRFMRQSDYFVTNDTLKAKYEDGPGAANNQDSPISSNLMYRYMNVSLETMARNLNLYEKVKTDNVKEDDAINEVVDFLCEFFKMYLYSHPLAKQHSMAACPTPSMVAIFTGKNIQTCDMSTAFNKVITADYQHSVAENAATRVVEWTEDDMPVDQYDTCKLWVPKNIKDSDTVETSHKINTCRSYIDEDLREILFDYFEEGYKEYKA